MASAIVLGTLGGAWLDRTLGSAPVFVLLGLALGLAGGFYGTYRMIRTSLMGRDGQEDEANDS